MSLQRTLVIVIASLCALAQGSEANAQHLLGLHAEHHDDNSDFSSLYDPVCEVDTAWFDPIDCYCPDQRPLNSGWFFEYSRVNINISRPRDQPGQLVYDPGGVNTPLVSVYTGNERDDYQGDWAWGNRFDFGWMSEDGTGLWVVARKLDNPNRRVFFDNIDLNEDAVDRFDNEPWGPTFVTLNGFNMWGVEVNHVWRLPPTPKGTVIEPFFGPRYVRLRDHADRNDVFTDTLANFPLTFAPNASLLRRLNFNYRQAVITTDNDLFGGQFGMRHRWRRGRWHITSDVRGLAFWNHSVKETLADNELQQTDVSANYDAAGNLASITNPTGIVVQTATQDNTYVSSNTFVYGGEVNLQAAFEITQGFAITAGGEIIAFGDGVGRGVDGIDDSLVLAGMTIGFTLNR